MNKVDAVTSKPAVTVDVTAFRWQWRFDFPQHRFSIIGVAGTPTTGPTIVLPVGQTVHFDVTAVDVIHSFYVPEFNFKRDAIPGTVNRFDITIPRAGRFRGECAEFCGVDHADMTFYIRAVSQPAFDAWVQRNEGAGLIQDAGT
jgi:cytochrome c oxidase subunit 2